MADFGELLRECRQRCREPQNPRRPLSQGRLGELLGHELDIAKGYSAAAISDWERGVSKIHADDRFLLASLIKVLKERGGISNLQQANDLLMAGNYRPLDPGEALRVFPNLHSTNQLNAQHSENVTSLEKGFAIEYWPPSLPFEPYYLLPEREKVLSELLENIGKAHSPRIISIEGLGGQGKTALAAELARRSLRHNLMSGVIGETAKQEFFADGEIIKLHNSTLEYEGLLDGLARQLQQWELFTMNTKEKEIRLSQIFAKSKYLVVVDNLETAADAQTIATRLNGILGTSQAIITSREKLRHNASTSLVLHGLSLEDSIFFMRAESQRIGASALGNADRALLSEIHHLSDGSPMAMKLVAAQARYLDLSRVMDQLRKARGNLFPFIFLHSWERLMPEAQNLLIYVGKTVMDTVSFTELAQVGIATSEEALIGAIDQLIGYSLLNYSLSSEEIRYSMHQLTRHFIINDLPTIWREQGLL